MSLNGDAYILDGTALAVSSSSRWCFMTVAANDNQDSQALARTALYRRFGWAVIGSSLGGFYATVVAERKNCRAVLLNPAVEPARDLAASIGTTTAWHSDEAFEFRPEYVEELRRVAPPSRLARPERYLAVIAKGDEVLSWREMSARYAGCQVQLLEGGDHALSDFDEHWPAIVDFLGLAPRSPGPSGSSAPG